MFELIPYSQLSDSRVPLLVGTRSLGVWSFYGVLIEEPRVSYNHIEAISTHFHENKAQYEMQVLFMIVYTDLESRVAIGLKNIYVESSEGEETDVEGMVELPVCEYGSQVNNFFDGSYEFHKNYPEFLSDVTPVINLVKKLKK